MTKHRSYRNTRTFLIVVFVTAVLWVVSAMSEIKEYPAVVKLDYVGYDTSRFSIVSAPDELPLTISSNGFHALSRNLSIGKRTLLVDLSTQIPEVADSVEQITLSLSTSQWMEEFRKELNYKGVQKIVSPKEQVTIQMAQRRKKTFVPQLRNVDFTFLSSLGVYGVPQLLPDTVVLYGSKHSLDQITSVYTAPATIANIKQSDTFELELEPVWEHYPDVYPSATAIQVFVPVASFAENTIQLPIHFDGADSTKRVRLYPDKVKVHYWVSKEEYSKVNPSDFEARVQFDPSSDMSKLKVTVSRFPAHIRIKSVEPEEISFVILQTTSKKSTF